MASPQAQANYKIERAAEAVESLAVAVAAAQGHPVPSKMFNNVRDARQELREAFAEFLSPVLRVIPYEAPPEPKKKPPRDDSIPMAVEEP